MLLHPELMLVMQPCMRYNIYISLIYKFGAHMICFGCCVVLLCSAGRLLHVARLPAQGHLQGQQGGASAWGCPEPVPSLQQ